MSSCEFLSANAAAVALAAGDLTSEQLVEALLGRIERSGGHVFYAGVRKTTQPDEHDANSLYSAMLREAIRRLDTFCAERPGGVAPAMKSSA